MCNLFMKLIIYLRLIRPILNYVSSGIKVSPQVEALEMKEGDSYVASYSIKNTWDCNVILD